MFLTKSNKELNVSLVFLAIFFISLFFADLSISAYEPFFELGKFVSGLKDINFSSFDILIDALFQTIYVASISIVLASFFGFLLSLYFDYIRTFLAFIRSIHEIFWALIFLQIFGLNAITAILAIVLPYSAILAKVYAEIFEEFDTFDTKTISSKSSKLSLFFYTKLPNAIPHIISYTLYRFECAMKSSAILGFIGVTTLGYYLSSSFNEGHYNDVWLMLIIFYLAIASIKYWFNKFTIFILFIVSLFKVDISFSSFSMDNFIRFISEDIVPSPIKNDASFMEGFSWFSKLFTNEVLPGIFNTIVLTQLSLVATAVLALVLFPIISYRFVNKYLRFFSHIFLVVLRSTPEYILAFIFLSVFGPSMLPAVLALMLHNGAIIAFIIGKQSNELEYVLDKSKHLNLYTYEVLPKLYNSFLAFLFYRWEVIMRESAILGILGITTLGFYIDSAISDIRLDKVMILLFFTALLNISIDIISKKVRAYLRVRDDIKSSCEIR
jgi:phosphonate transport system permease protein